MIKKLLLVVLISSLVCACGWRLRGTLALPGDLNTLHVAAEDAHGSLVTELRRTLSAQNVQLMADADKAQYSVIILNERNRRRVVSVGNNALAAEYELTLEIEYRIQPQATPGDGEATTARVVRSFTFNEIDVVGKAEEERLIESEMRREVVQQIVRRLQVIARSTTAAASEATSPHGKTAP